MKTQFAFVYLAAGLVATGASTSALAAASVPSTSSKPSQALAESARPTPRELATKDSPRTRHLFTVNDEKGLLLTCVAPEIDINSETDNFKNCTLAPGRTLDDVMHSFVQGIHEEQRQRMKEHTQSEVDPAENGSGKSAQK